MNWMRIIDAVDRSIPDADGRLAMRLQKTAVMVGAAIEMSASTPSEKEIGDYIGITHQTVGQALGRWRAIPWKDRYNWLRFVEGRLHREKDTVDAALL